MASFINEEDLKDLQRRINLMKQGKARVSANEICWKFWAFAAPLICRENHNKGIFQDPFYTGTKIENNAIADSLGIQGISVCCTMNKNSALVEILFETEYPIAHAVYEHLYDHRHEVSETMGLPLRYENFRGNYPARIFIVNPNVALLNLLDWTAAAKFFADVTRKIADFFALFFIIA